MHFFINRMIALVFILGLLTACAQVPTQTPTQITKTTQPTQAGLRFIELATDNANKETTRVALFYPTQTEAATVAMGPFSPTVAINAPPDQSFKGLIVLSHGLGGTELGHVTLAQALARAGYLVAAMRHPRDNYRDRSLLNESGIGYFVERPKQVTRVIDALLENREWSSRIAQDSQGYRIGALGHSAGGYTVLALAGGKPELTQLLSHCEKNRTDDPIFCGVGRLQPTQASATNQPPSPPLPMLRDTRIRAVAALAPTGAMFNPASLEEIRLPVALYIAGGDRFLVPRFHGERVAKYVRGIEVNRDQTALHFSFMDKPNMPIPTEDGDIGADPAGFDRADFLAKISSELVLFFDKSLAK
jgi:predicted dienelactone hydrolase